MSLQSFDFKATRLQDLYNWFIDIWHHLGKENYQNSEWLPVIHGVTGAPTVSAKVTRWGQTLDFTVTVNGACTFSSAYIDNLPFAATDYGFVSVYRIGSKALIGQGHADKETKKVYFSDFSSAGGVLIISGACRISGI